MKLETFRLTRVNILVRTPAQEIVQVPSLVVFKIRLSAALSNLL